MRSRFIGPFDGPFFNRRNATTAASAAGGRTSGA